jgi:hypothetical protein
MLMYFSNFICWNESKIDTEFEEANGRGTFFNAFVFIIVQKLCPRRSSMQQL